MRISMIATSTLFAISLCDWSVVTGFSPLATGRHISTTTISYTNSNHQIASSSLPSSLYAGFGGGSEASSKKNKKSKSAEIKLKPKQQWDRYVEFKDEADIAVAVRVRNVECEWLDVGSVKSHDSKYTPQAVFRQRALMVEHAKRLHPVQLANSKQQLEWAYCVKSDEKDKELHWEIVDKSCMDANIESVGLDKLIGFKGRPDPMTGFYTDIDNGRMDSSALRQKDRGGSGSSVSGSNKKGPGDGVI